MCRNIEKISSIQYNSSWEIGFNFQICIDAMINEQFVSYHTVIEKVTSEGIFVKPLTKDGIVFEIGGNKVFVNVEVVYRNVVYKWKNVQMWAEKEKNTLYYFIEIKENPEVINRRKYTRLEISNPCKLKFVKGGEEAKAEMKNISANGFCFTCRADLFRDKKFEEIDLEIDGFEVVNNKKLRGEILRVTESEGVYTVGGRLAKDYLEIDQYIKARN